MPANVALFADEALTNNFDFVSLGETVLDGDLSTGEPRQIFGKNNGDTNLRDLCVYVRGEGSTYLQLAVDDGGKPGVWTDTGESLVLGDVGPDGKFSFWSRAIYHLEDIEAVHDFEFVIRATSVST